MARAPKVPPAELPPEERYKKAKEICYDLLAVRARTQEELRQALRRKGFDEETSETYRNPDSVIVDFRVYER